MNPPPSAVPAPLRTFTLLATGLAVGGLTGWFARSHSPDSSAAAPSSLTQPANSSTRPHGGPDSSSTADSRPLPAPQSKQFAETVRAILHETLPERRLAMFQKLLDHAGPEHYAVIVSLIRENDLRGSGSAGEWTRLWATWGQKDPASAFQFLKTQDWSRWNPLATQEAQSQTLTGWAETDPQAARKFLEESPELASGDRSMVFGVVRGWAEIDPVATADWLFGNGLAMREEYKMVVENISRQGGQEALDKWFSTVNQTGDPATLAGFAKAIADTKQAYEPEKAAAWVDEHLKEPWMEESEIVSSTARAFANRDPKAAMEWAQRTGLDSAATYAMATWCQTNLAGASAWLQENPTSPAYGPSATVLVNYLQRSDPAAARTWAESIPDPAIRQNTLQHLQQLPSR
jgi:hypothetical protein